MCVERSENRNKQMARTVLEHPPVESVLIVSSPRVLRRVVLAMLAVLLVLYLTKAGKIEGV